MLPAYGTLERKDRSADLQLNTDAWLLFSRDGGKTWSDMATISDPAVGRPNHYPALLELPDGRILSVYHVGNHWPYPPPEDEWIHATSFRVKR